MSRFLIICFLLSNLFTNEILASRVEPQSDVPPFDEPYIENGYKSVGEALKECETLNQRELKLPIKLPPMEFTHYLGRCVNDKENYNDEFQIEYLHESQGKNHYMIDVRPIEQKIDLGKSKRDRKKYKFKDGSEALYFTTKSRMANGGFNILVFEKNGWQYRLAVDSRIENHITADVLFGIAESIK